MKLINSILGFIKTYELLFLFSLFYLIYNLNWRTIGSGDTIPASMLPFSILENHNIYLDNFYQYWKNAHIVTYFVIEVNHHYLSTYPIVAPILITPLYAIPYLLLKLNYILIDLSNPGFNLIVSIMEKLAASFIAALAGIFVFLSLKELINRRTALIGTMIFAFATNTWTISSQGLWQHGLVELFLALSIYLVLLNEKQNSDKIIMSLGILSGLFFLNRPVDVVLLIPVLYYIITLKDRRIVYYFGLMALSGGPFLLYNYYYFGNPFGGYSILLSGFSLNPTNITYLAGLLISPSRGLFVYTPILIFSVFGYLKTSQIQNKNIRNFLMIFGFSVSISLLIYSCFNCWWAGWSYGPRFLTGMLPALVMFLGLYIRDIKFNIKTRKNLLIVCIISILLIWSVFAQLVGAFYYPNGNWDGKPQSVDSHPDRIWDIKDTQIERSFNAGIIYPHNPLNDLRFIMFWGRMGPIDHVALRAHNGQYICAEEGGGREVVANRNSVGPWEIFGLRDLGNNSVALIASNCQYVSADGGCKIIANSDFMGPREIFGLKDLGNNSVALLASSGQYISVESEREVVAKANSVGPRETFGLEQQ